MEQLTSRQQKILSLIIEEHIRSAEPVASSRLLVDYHLDLSSATVRNEMAFLTKMGYLRQPHTSAGRVPTEEGYRYFVGNLMRNTIPFCQKRCAERLHTNFIKLAMISRTGCTWQLPF